MIETMTITELLDRIEVANHAILKKLLDAPISLTGDKEPELYGLMLQVQRETKQAKTVWNA
jgi:hypothetical protein